MVNYNLMTAKSSLENQRMKETPPPSFVKLAMRNMVSKGKQSLFHFSLTTIGFVIFILILAFFGRPNLPQ